MSYFSKRLVALFVTSTIALTVASPARANVTNPEMPWCNAKIVFKKFKKSTFLKRMTDDDFPARQDVIDHLLARAYYLPSEKVIYLSQYLQAPRLKKMRLFITAHECAHHEQFFGINKFLMPSCLLDRICSMRRPQRFPQRFLMEVDASCRAARQLIKYNREDILTYMKDHYRRVMDWDRKNYFTGPFRLVGPRNTSLIETIDYCRKTNVTVYGHLMSWLSE